MMNHFFPWAEIADRLPPAASADQYFIVSILRPCIQNLFILDDDGVVSMEKRSTRGLEGSVIADDEQLSSDVPETLAGTFHYIC